MIKVTFKKKYSLLGFCNVFVLKEGFSNMIYSTLQLSSF